MARILIIDDEEAVREALAAVIGHSSRAAETSSVSIRMLPNVARAVLASVPLLPFIKIELDNRREQYLEFV